MKRAMSDGGGVGDNAFSTVTSQDYDSMRLRSVVTNRAGAEDAIAHGADAHCGCAARVRPRVSEHRGTPPNELPTAATAGVRALYLVRFCGVAMRGASVERLCHAPESTQRAARFFASGEMCCGGGRERAVVSALRPATIGKSEERAAGLTSSGARALGTNARFMHYPTKDDPADKKKKKEERTHLPRRAAGDRALYERIRQLFGEAHQYAGDDAAPARLEVAHAGFCRATEPGRRRSPSWPCRP